MSFNTVTIQRELRHLLIGQYEREGQRRATRNSDSFSTAVGCPHTNAAFVSQSRVGAEWNPSDTWEQVRRELENASPNRAGAKAALYLLHQVDPPEGLSRADQQMWRQKKAAKVLGMIWAEDKFRFRDDRTVKFASDIVDRAVTALQDALRDAVASTAVALSVAAQQRFKQNAEQIGIEEDLKSSFIQRLESLPGHYPAHLTTSVLAPLLNPHVHAAEERQVIDSVPVLPPFPRDEFDEVSQLLRTEGARTFITGEPGSGKSTLLRFVAMKQMNELTGSVGIFLSIADLSRVLLERTMTLSEVLNMVVDLTDEVLTSLNSDAKAYILRRLEFDDSSVICLDGLDEVPEGILTERAQRAIDVLSRIPGSIVVSSRPKPRTIPSGDWTAITMRPMSDDRANQLFDLWFENPDDPGKARARDALLSDAGYSMRVPAVIVTGQGAAVPISRSPLILGFVAFAASFDREYDSITDLYEQYIALTLERIWKAPGLREYNDVKIEHMMRLLRVLAWHMAGGARDDSEWRDAESLQRILQVTKRSDREYLARIVQAEGLFSLATPAASRLHTSYRWVHRTIQEHLVAMYLLEEDSRDPDVMVHRLLEGLSGSDDWRVIIKHAFTKMTPDVQARLVEQLVSAQDDSRYITGEAGNLLLNLAPFVRAEKVAQIIATDARRRGMWPTFFYVDARNARAALLETAEKDTPIRAMGARFPQLASTFDVQYLLDLHSRLIERPKLHFARLLEVCLALETRQPLAGVTAYFDVIAAGPPGLLRTEWPEELVGRMDIRSISRRISEHTELSVRWRLVYFLMKNLCVDPAPFVKPNGPLDVVEFNLAQIVERRITGDTYSVGETLKAALSGEFGDAIAYVAAQSFVAPVMRNVVKHSWGIVGAWEQLLVSEEIGDPGALLQPEVSSAAEIVSQYRTDWRRDPAKMAQLYEALWKGKRNPASVETSVLVEFYRLIVCDLDRSKFDYVHACVPVSVLTKIIFPILRRRGWATVADVILRQDAELWVGSKGRIPALEEFFLGEYWISGDGWSGDQFEEHWDSMSGLLSRIVSWGSEAGIAMLQVSRPAISVARAFEELPIFDLNPEVFSLPENLAWLDRILLFKFEREWRYFRSEYLAEVRFASSDLSRTVVDVWHLESLFDQK